MKAAINTRYGPPDVVKVMDIPVPVPKENEMLVKVFASSVTRTDCGFRSAEYFISRFWSGLLKPKFHTLGCEFAGEVVQTGGAVRSFRKGDRVFGYNDRSCGGHAEYLVISENEIVDTIPPGLTYEEAVPITEGAHYALGGIRAAGVKSGHNVLVYGATGAIGSAGVQLLKYFGARVTAVCNTKNVGLVTSLGADLVIDYMKEDFTRTPQTFDFILDAVGKSSFGQCKPLLNERGIYISTELGKNSENVFRGMLARFMRGKKVLFPIPTFTKADIKFLKELVMTGKFKPVIDRVYTLDEIVEAYRYVETRQKVGNVVIRISQ